MKRITSTLLTFAMVLGAPLAFAQELPPANRAEALMMNIRQDLMSLQGLRAKAKTGSELEACINKEMIPLQGLLSLTLVTQHNLKLAESQNNVAHVELESRKLDVIANKAEEFSNQAYACSTGSWQQ